MLRTIMFFRLLAGVQGVTAIVFNVPGEVGSGGYAYASLDVAPIGISFEFFAFPSYFTNVTATTQCLANWKSLTGVWPPIRIGGTTQDRASYDPTTPAHVVYTVANAADAPSSLTFGPSFMVCPSANHMSHCRHDLAAMMSSTLCKWLGASSCHN